MAHIAEQLIATVAPKPDRAEAHSSVPQREKDLGGRHAFLFAWWLDRSLFLKVKLSHDAINVQGLRNVRGKFTENTGDFAARKIAETNGHHGR